MKRRIRRVLVVTMLVLVLATMPMIPAFAGNSENVTVTSVPAFISIANAPGTWTPNDLVGDGVTPKGFVGPDTIYFSNPTGDENTPSDPVVDGECRFTITNTSTIPIDLTVLFPDFTGGDASTNGDTGSNGTTTFGAYSYFSGDNYSTEKVIAKDTGSDTAYASLGAGVDILWGLMYETQTDDWTSGTSMESTANITAISS